MAWRPLAGTVKNVYTGSGINGATVSAWDSGTGMTATAQTDSGGGFSFDLLEDGSYKLTVTKTGFVTYEGDLVLPTATDLSIELVSKDFPV